MIGGKCSRCGADDSMFWYPYAFGMIPISSMERPNLDRSEYFMLCDSCQAAFVNFMHMKLQYCEIENIRKAMK